MTTLITDGYTIYVWRQLTITFLPSEGQTGESRIFFHSITDSKRIHTLHNAFVK